MSDLHRHLAQHLGSHLTSLLPGGLTSRAHGSAVSVDRDVPDPSSVDPGTIVDVELTGFRPPPGEDPPRALAEMGGVGARTLDTIQDAVSIETREAWPKVGGAMGVPAVEIAADAVVLGFGTDRNGPPDPAWSLPPFRPT